MHKCADNRVDNGVMVKNGGTGMGGYCKSDLFLPSAHAGHVKKIHVMTLSPQCAIWGANVCVA